MMELWCHVGFQEGSVIFVNKNENHTARWQPQHCECFGFDDITHLRSLKSICRPNLGTI